MNFSTMWRFEAIRLAAMEQLDMQGYLDPHTLFKRGREIYNKGFEESIDKWNSVWEGEADEKAFSTKKAKAEPKKQKKIVKKDGVKVCPTCGENVPAGWIKHSYKKDGTKCGHEFE
jgi:formylmethanofuran dehydrogenase subunit E